MVGDVELRGGVPSCSTDYGENMKFSKYQDIIECIEDQMCEEKQHKPMDPQTCGEVLKNWLSIRIGWMDGLMGIQEIRI